ncbi:DNA primase [Salipiger sp.]|uniref:DNA primase n=1 Tax=Salipiger sp. TaxID=2078585 RepID=UPI003A969E18
MSLPPGFLDELRTRTSLVQVVGRKVLWDSRKSNQGKGDMWAPCPFHQEKSASFHVDDRKGFYYCFGCQAKGDAISFVKETENVEFMEAVEILAREAGMTMPARDPQAQVRTDRRDRLAAVMEQALRWFRLQLRTGAAAEARGYLERRGLKEPVQDRFELGFAPGGWQNLWSHLRGQGVAEELILGCGLAKASDKGREPYDVFRNRIMFPIRDGRGRAIAFGGRAMDPADNAKYLNSPETELFDKGRSLYNHGPAREAAGKGKPLIVAEGYMDVIALCEAGFDAAVAPLGTAVTEHQLALLWRISPEPVVALDGDKAGLRAAYRVVDLALPLLEAGKSLRFALMPEGKDPDDLLRAEGAGAVQKVLDGALPMVSLLWRKQTEGRVFDSPERKAALDAELREKLRLIRDPGLRRHYGDEIKDLRWQLFRPKRGGGGGAGGARGGRKAWNAPEPPTSSAKRSLLATGDEAVQVRLREVELMAVLLRYPRLILEFEHRIEALRCADEDLGALRAALLRHAERAPETVGDCVGEEIGRQRLETLLSARHLGLVPCLRREDAEFARLTVNDHLNRIEAAEGRRLDLSEAESDIHTLADEVLTERLKLANAAFDKVQRGNVENRAEVQVAPNGVAMDREEIERAEAIRQQIRFSKGAD